MEKWGLEESALKRQIEEAFASFPYPGDDKLVEKDSPEYLDVAERFKGKHWIDWKDHPTELLMKTVGDLSFFSPAAFCYYLPLYMLQVLLNNTEYPFSGEVIGNLAPLSTPWGNGWVKKRLSLMNPSQLVAVLAFLKYIKEKQGDDLRTYPLDEAVTTVSKAMAGK